MYKKNELGKKIEYVLKTSRTVSIFAKGGDMWADLVHEHLALSGLSHVYHLLHHVVGILILHQHQEGAVGIVTVPTHL